MRVSLSPYLPSQLLLSLASVITVLLTSVRGYSTRFWFAFPWWLVMLKCLSCTCWSTECLWKNRLFRSFAHLVWLSGILLLSFLYILYIKPLLDTWFEIFLPVHSWLFILLIVSFAVQKLLSLMWSHCFVLLATGTYGIIAKNLLLRPMSSRFSFKSFQANFCEWCKIGPIQSLACDYPVFPKPSVKETVFSPVSIVGSLKEYELTVYTWIYSWAPS